MGAKHPRWDDLLVAHFMVLPSCTAMGLYTGGVSHQYLWYTVTWSRLRAVYMWAVDTVSPLGGHTLKDPAFLSNARVVDNESFSTRRLES